VARFRAAVVGLGRIASTIDDEQTARFEPWAAKPYAHISCYLNDPATQIVGLADFVAEKREAARARYGLDVLYADYRDMLRATRPDIVSICTSTTPRTDIIVEIASGGYGVKAIWAEKPLAISLEQADRAIAACRAHGVVLAVNCSRRWDGVYRRALDLIAAGTIGDVLHVLTLAECPISAQGSHVLTTLTLYTGGRAQWVVGEVESDAVAATDNDFKVTAYLGFPNGVRAYLRTFDNGPAEYTTEIIGTKGLVRIVQDGLSAQLFTLQPPIPGMRGESAGERLFPMPVPRQTAQANTLADILACVESGAEPKCTGEDAREALEIAIAARESHRRGQARVDLPLADRCLRLLDAHGSERRYRDALAAAKP